MLAMEPLFIGVVSDHNIFMCSSIVVLLMWLKLFYWLRLFQVTAVFVRLITETLFDIKEFIVLIGMLILAFGNALLILHLEDKRVGGDGLFDEVFGISFFDATIN